LGVFESGTTKIPWLIMKVPYVLENIRIFWYLLVSGKNQTQQFEENGSEILDGYPLVIQHSHGKWPIYRWFTY